MKIYAVLLGLLFILLLPLTWLLAQSPPTEYFRVSPWDYWVATPTWSRMCSPVSSHCYSNIVSPGHILGYQDNGIYATISILPTGTGVTRDYVGGLLRCFSDTPGNCTTLPSYPPGYAPTVDTIPVLDSSILGTTQPTPQAKLYLSAQTFQVNIISTTNCSVTYSGAITQSASHFVLSSLDLGPMVGVLSNVYVQEFYSGIPSGAVDPRYGVRMERYFFAPGLGRMRQEGWNDPICAVNPTPATCLGNYTQASPAADVWALNSSPVMPVITEICP